MVVSVEAVSGLDIRSRRYFVSLVDFCATGLPALIVIVWKSMQK